MKAKTGRLLATLGLVLFVGCKKPAETTGTTPDAPTAHTTGSVPATPAAPTAAAAPDFTMSATDFSKIFKGDQEAAKAKFAGKTIQLTGVVLHYSSNSSGPYFDCAGEALASVHFFPEEFKVWDNIGIGDTITARGLLFSGDLTFGLHHCVLVNSTGAPPLAMTSKALAQKFYADTNGFNGQFIQVDPKVIPNNVMRIDGKVVAKQTGKWASLQIVLEGTDDLHLVPVAVVNRSSQDAVQVGQHVTVFGNWNSPSGDNPKEAMLNNAVVIRD